MMLLSPDQIKKLELLDSLFGALDAPQIMEIAESEQIVSKLKGITSPGILRQLVSENEKNSTEIMMLRAEVQGLKHDLLMLIKAVNTIANTPTPYSQDLQTLKTKHNIY